MLYIFFNPVFILSLSLLLGLFSTFLGWSELFQPVSSETCSLFLIVSIIGIFFSIMFHHYYSTLLKEKVVNLITSFSYSSNDKYLVLLLLFFLFLEVGYSGYVPLLAGNYDSILEGSFGIPLLHGLYLSFVSYVSIVFFQKLLSCKITKTRNGYFAFIIILNVVLILMGRRGAIVFNLFCYFFLFALYYVCFGKNIKKLIIAVSIFLVVFLYGFNYIGNLRLGVDSNDFILGVGKASADFRESIIPKEFFYGYLYLSTPVQIFDLNRYDMDLPLSNFLMANIVPDFISKRLGFKSDVELEQVNGFNVGGIFLSPYRYLGEVGVVLILLYHMLIFLLVILAIRNDKKRSLVSLVILISISLLLSFDNLLNYSGYIIQLYYALFFTSVLKFNYAGISILPARLKGR